MKQIPSWVCGNAAEICVCNIQAIASPVSGMLGDKFDRTKVIAAGCMIWGLMTSAIAMANSIFEVNSSKIIWCKCY